ncbi:MAG: RNA polymerase sigma factor [Myxococcales bacterium]
MVESVADEKLMLAYKAGDVRSFEELVRRHRGAVYNFLFRLSNNRQRAEDLLQETWLKVVRSAGTYEAKAKFTTWVYTIARNLCMDAIRKDSYRKADSLDATSGEGEDERALSEKVASADAQPDRTAHAASLRPVLAKAISRLPPEQREVFVLREYHGVQFKDIAEVTGVPENTVKSRMRYALESLRKFLAEAGVEGDMAEEPKGVVSGVAG